MRLRAQVPAGAAIGVSLAVAALSAFTGGPAGAQQSPSPLRDTVWRLVEIRSMDGGQQPRRPPDPSRYTLRLKGDGHAVLQRDCNRATGSWTAEPSGDPSNGSFRFGTLAATGALCPPPTLGEPLGVQLPAVRGYTLRGGLLNLSLLADGGVMLLEPLPSAEVRYRNDPDPALEAAILRNVSGYSRSVVGNAPERWGRYVHAATDLDGDGRDEVFVYLMGSLFCGTGGCTLQVYRLTPRGFALVNDCPITRLPVVAAKARSHGWRDLWRLESGGGAPATYVRHTFNGEHYEQMERIPAEQGRPNGLALLTGNPTHAEGIVLKPSD